MNRYKDNDQVKGRDNLTGKSNYRMVHAQQIYRVGGWLLGYLSGVYLRLRKMPIDPRFPDLSENQVIVFTEWMGRSPQLIEDQVTYPLVTNLQGIPKDQICCEARRVWYELYLCHFVDDDVMFYWPEKGLWSVISTISSTLPQGATPQLGPDGSGCRTCAMVYAGCSDTDLGEQRAIQAGVAVGFIALFGIAVETGIVMVIYLNDAMQQLVKLRGNSSETISKEELREYVIPGAASVLGQS
ncbi:hypothetical protein FQR65_LT15188 [Abscondita terminalis]|nr:hypothetical protein FQR65_LT15188 [Abscondita terminalis]